MLMELNDEHDENVDEDELRVENHVVYPNINVYHVHENWFQKRHHMSKDNNHEYTMQQFFDETKRRIDNQW